MDYRSNLISEPPLEVTCVDKGFNFTRGVYIGSGHTSACFEFADLSKKEIYAGKVISKHGFNNSKIRKKINNEIEILSSLRHNNIMNLICHFDDFKNIYLVLEYCHNLTLRQFFKIRRVVLEHEARYLVKQLSEACIYLHSKNIVHRNLRMGTLYLTSDLLLKVGKFEVCKRICPNGNMDSELVRGVSKQVDPEFFANEYPFKIDIWSIGCVLYKLIYRKNAFRKPEKKNSTIKMSTYRLDLPPNGSAALKELIISLLHVSSKRRPDAKEILDFKFFTDAIDVSTVPKSLCGRLSFFPSHMDTDAVKDGSSSDNYSNAKLPRMWNRVKFVLENPRRMNKIITSEDQKPALKSPCFVTRWTDYSNNNGLFYQLSDNSVGVAFNDKTNLIMDNFGERLRYRNSDGSEILFSRIGCPSDLQDKLHLLLQASKYMSENLVETLTTQNKYSKFRRSPVLKRWLRTNRVIIFWLSDETLQFNFIDIHRKIILSSEEESITIIDRGIYTRSFTLEKFEKAGGDKGLQPLLKMLENHAGMVPSDGYDIEVLSGNIEPDFFCCVYNV
uniref:Polo kinase n=1 Tax=Strongyloides venezuelensis TaxID=75913 RepID=A0A0K0G0I9_STRVS